MLIMRKFDGVEKIKTIGSTYMVASGLSHGNDATQVHATDKASVLSLTVGWPIIWYYGIDISEGDHILIGRELLINLHTLCIV